MAITPQERRRLAMQEVEVNRPSGLMVVMTMEFTHPDLTETVRVVADNEDLTAALETGETVTFQKVAFQAVGPAQSDSRWPEIGLSIDGASGIIEPYLDRALLTDAPIEVTFREYIRERAADGPGRVIAGLELDRTTSGDLTISGTAGFFGLDRKFGKTYDPSIYPGLS